VAGGDAAGEVGAVGAVANKLCDSYAIKPKSGGA
jgi:hypothetical protein